MTVYIDNDFKCHVTNDGTMTAVEIESFDGKCDEFIEGYRFVPLGDVGGMLSPWKDYKLLAAYQEQYESLQEELADMKAALAELEVRIDG